MRSICVLLAISGVASADTFTDHTKMLDPIQVESLTLTPIIATGATQQDDLMVLDEAMPKKLVKIHEIESGHVNDLTLDNKSDKPLFLLAGEVVIGGKQDRIIGKNTIVPAKTTQTVPVFCVEHGRWQGDSKEFTTAKALAHGRLRGSANFDGQQDVWNEVAAKNVARKTTSSTDTYRRVAAQQSDGTQGSWQKKVDSGLDKMSPEDRAKLVGFAVAVNGKVAVVDVFQSPQLFAKLKAKLVQSYITEAEDVKAAKEAKPPTADQVKAFVSDAEKAKAEASYETEMATSETKKGAHSAQAKVMYKPAKKAADANNPYAPPPPAPAAVYETYMAH
jgi:hypothetical protein